MLRIVWLEYKKNFFKKRFLISIIIIFVLMFSYTQKVSKKELIFDNLEKSINNNKSEFNSDEKKIDKEKLDYVIKAIYPQQAFGFISQFIIIYCAANNLVREFKLGTSSFLFSSKRKRYEIIFFKILSIILLSITFAIFSYFLGYYINLVSEQSYSNKFYDLIIIYSAYAWFVCNFVMLFVVIFKNNLTSFVSSIFSMMIIDSVLSKIKQSDKINNSLINYLVFDEIFCFLSFAQVNTIKFIFMILLGFIFFLVTCLIFNNQDLS
ncbi:MAG: ABC transporter permease subunit [Clostridiales bacterium]|nr:ABC transporter permease subunit [Clostridiales bacterium]